MPIRLQEIFDLCVQSTRAWGEGGHLGLDGSQLYWQPQVRIFVFKSGFFSGHFVHFGNSRSRGSNGLLYTQKKFGWTVTDYTNYQSFWVVHMSVKVIKKYSHLPIMEYLQTHQQICGSNATRIAFTEHHIQNSIVLCLIHLNQLPGIYNDAFSLLLPASA